MCFTIRSLGSPRMRLVDPRVTKKGGFVFKHSKDMLQLKTAVDRQLIDQNPAYAMRVT